MLEIAYEKSVAAPRRGKQVGTHKQYRYEAVESTEVFFTEFTREVISALGYLSPLGSQ